MPSGSSARVLWSRGPELRLDAQTQGPCRLVAGHPLHRDRTLTKTIAIPTYVEPRANKGEGLSSMRLALTPS